MVSRMPRDSSGFDDIKPIASRVQNVRVVLQSFIDWHWL